MAVDWTKARHWEFLRPHFERLRGRLTTHHDVRFPYSHAVSVGIDVADWWICVSLDGLTSSSQLRALRDALLLVGAFAQLQRACCLQYLQTFSLWHRAPFVDLEDTRFLPRFRLDVAAVARGALSQSFHAALSALLGGGDDDDNGASAGFVSDWARVLDMQDRVGGAQIELEPVEIFVNIEAAGVAADTQPLYFHCIADAIRGVQAAQQERSFVPHGERVLLEPVFAVRTMDLALERAGLSLGTMEELRGLVALGVPLNNVEFPAMVAALGEASWRFAWCELLCTITGVASSSGSVCSPSVRRLIVPSEFVRGPLLSSMFSALVFARGVGELQLGKLVSGPESRETERQRTAGGDEVAVLETVDPNFWFWLACLLLPDDSFSSTLPIETVSLLGARIHEAAMSTLETVARSKPAIRHVAQALVAGIDLDEAPATNQLKTVSICAGTVLTLHEINGRKDFVTVKALTGKVVQDGHGSSPAVLIVPGLGVCSATETTLPAKRARTMANGSATLSTNVALKNLKFIAPPRGSQSLPVLHRLVQLVGPSLEGLHVSTQRMTHATVARLLQLCPALESLSVTGVRIESLDFLWDAYVRGCKLSSLEFATDPSLWAEMRGWQLTPRLALGDSAMESLLYQLMSHQTAISRTLTRLSLVRCDLHHDHCPLLDDMLANNQSLTHFWLVGCRSSGMSGQWIHERHHGELLRDAPPIPLAQSQRLAFLSVLRHQRQGNNDAFQLDSFVGSSIFQFAATQQRRSVVRSLK